ncbi:hypothetical protein [Wolbachia endosymbiont (group A) of Conops quadrifasciatus]|uniref:hypothetical protein n=1 Tax=Wolbachia endosymbiont (group A) of Conops quadrifasciatus TaxID=3066143 RepID=UPI003132FC8A
MPKDDQNEESTSILAKVGNTALGVGSFLGRGAKALFWGIIYPIQPKNWFKSRGEMWHDIKNGWRYVIGSELEKYDPPIKTTQASENLGVEITEQKKGKGKVAFLASRTLTGDIPYLNDEQLGKIKVGLPNVTIFREENKIVIEINVEEIANTIKTNPDNKGKSEKEIKELVLKGIANKVDEDLKKLAGITGGEFKIHTDLKLLNGIAEKLYREYDNQNKPSETLRPAQTGKSPGQSSETVTSTDELVKSFNITNPNEFPFGKSKETIFPIENMQLSEGDIKEQAEGLGSTFLNFEDTSGEVIKPLSTPDVERNKGRGKGRS